MRRPVSPRRRDLRKQLSPEGLAAGPGGFGRGAIRPPPRPGASGGPCGRRGGQWAVQGTSSKIPKTPKWSLKFFLGVWRRQRSHALRGLVNSREDKHRRELCAAVPTRSCVGASMDAGLDITDFYRRDITLLGNTNPVLLAGATAARRRAPCP